MNRYDLLVKCLLSILLAVALLPSGADAAAQKNVPAYLDIALNHFPTAASAECPEGISVQFKGPESFEGKAVAAGGWCSAWVNQDYYAQLSWEEGCLLIVRVAGHAYGIRDSTDPADVMYAGGERATFLPCRAGDPIRAIERELYRAEDHRNLWQARVYLARERVYYRRRMGAPVRYRHKAERTLRQTVREYRQAEQRVRFLSAALRAIEQEQNHD